VRTPALEVTSNQQPATTEYRDPEMTLSQHLKQLFLFWKPTVARRLTFYFTLFGLLVFYLTSVGYLVAAKKHLAATATRMVRTEIERIAGIGRPDFWWGAVDRPQPRLRELAELLTNLTASVHRIHDVSIYSRRHEGAPWHRLRLDDNAVLRAAPVSEPFLKRMRRLDDTHGPMVEADSDLFMTRRDMVMLINITRAGDQGETYFKLGITRSGVACLLGEGAARFVGVTLMVLVILRIIGYLFARRVAAPIETLSAAAARVAQGDLTPEIGATDRSEIGQLGRNFNQMVGGLREWQRIKAIEVELEKGRAIQRDFLPRELPRHPDWEIATRFQPAREVSGDFYDVFDLPGGMLGLVIADVCDKGVGSALYMALIRSLIRVYAEQKLAGALTLGAAAAEKRTDPADLGLEAVQLTNTYLARHHGEEGMFATLFFGVLDPDSGRVHYINGGHEPLFLVGAGGIKSELPPTGPAVGAMEGLDFAIGQLQMAPGDLLLGFTDGVTEARNAADELFTRQRLRDLLSRPAGSAREMLERIGDQLKRFIGNAPPLDDVTLLAVQRSG
jgi:serine phosphatase RsbU (regulator of sigma subunit)